MTANDCTAVLCRITRAIPILAYAIRCLEEERFEELATLGIVLMMAAVLAVLIWGFAALIVIMKLAAAITGLLILSATRG